MMDFKMPTHEETQEKIRFWSERIVGKTLVDDLSENNDTRVVEAHRPSPSRDEKDSSAGDEGEKKEQEKEEEQAEPEKQEQELEKDEPEKQEEPEEEEKANAADDDSNVVLISSLPTPVRVIKPGSRITRDLRPHRMNVICNKEGLITDVKFY
ncbi:hypothetical protein GGI11_001774 [Coemansia sp. RSA 2049]|nr:hypothetical protein GGI11_001774 [Coemansia sp. RSA 2049]KAJ2599109.1 hypothetical protein EV177_007399 [Coemansia sp. RSA 1804]KAJ2683948.1 hypothetical protein GGH99_004200 [Coemansia sp. RSA 1285]